MTELFPFLTIIDGGSSLFFGAARFAGFSFVYSLFILWVLLQGLVWLAERYSDLVSGVQWWRSAVLSLASMLVMVLAWDLPTGFRSDAPENLIFSMTSSIALGGLVAWFLCGQLYQFDIVHRIIVAVGVPLFVFCSLALGQTVAERIPGGF